MTTDPPAGGPRPPPSLPSPPRSACILVADAHDGSRRALARLLRLSGYTVHAAASVAEAHVLAAAGACDLLVAEIELPDGSGLDLLRQMRDAFRRRHPDRPPLPAVALTGLVSAEAEQACRAAGFDAFVPKPARPAGLLEVIGHLTAPAPGRPASSGGD